MRSDCHCVITFIRAPLFLSKKRCYINFCSFDYKYSFWWCQRSQSLDSCMAWKQKSWCHISYGSGTSWFSASFEMVPLQMFHHVVTGIQTICSRMEIHNILAEFLRRREWRPSQTINFQTALGGMEEQSAYHVRRDGEVSQLPHVGGRGTAVSARSSLR